MKAIAKTLKRIFFKTNASSGVWEYGTCNGTPARRHRANNNVQFVFWRAGEQGHREECWIDFDSYWWSDFTPANNTKTP